MDSNEPVLQQELPASKKPKSNWKRTAIVIALVALLAGLEGYTLGAKHIDSSNKERTAKKLPLNASPTSPPAQQKAGSEETNAWDKDAGISLKYPADWYDEALLPKDNGIKPEGSGGSYRPVALINDGNLTRGGCNNGEMHTFTRFIAITLRETTQTPDEHINEWVELFDPEIQARIRKHMNIQDYSLNGIPAKLFNEPGICGRESIIAVSN